MYSNREILAAAALLLIVGMVSTGIAAAYPASLQDKALANPTSPDLTSPGVRENIEYSPLKTTPVVSGSSARLAPTQPHYFLHEGKTSTGTLASSFNNVVYRGGPTMHISINYAIFWLPNGTSFEQSQGTDSSYMSLIERFLNDTGGTSYYNILNQYPDNVSGTPLNKSVLGGTYLDKTHYPTSGTTTSPLHDSDIQAEVTRAMAANNWIASPSKMFHVFTGYGIESCFDPNNISCTFNAYCAYHSFFTQSSQPIIYSSMPDFNGVSGRCTPQGHPPPNNDYYADPEINILSHELFEAVSNPLLNAWTDGAAREIGDKCAWFFGSVNNDGTNLVLNGHKYLVQLEWSNYDDGCTLSYGPAHSVSIMPSSESNPFPSATIFNITYTSQGSRLWTTTSYTNGTLAINIDQDTQIAITNSAPVAQTEKWCFDQNCGNVSFESGNGAATTYYYFDVLAQHVSVLAGASVLSAPVVFATGPITPNTLGFPQQITVQLNQTSQTIWVQRGTTVSVTSPTNAGLNTRWVTRVSTWIISIAMQIPNPIVYYPQYLTTFQFIVSGGGSYFFPSVTYYDNGLPKTSLAGTSVWADSATAYAYQSVLPGSSQYERWSTTTPDGLVSAPGITISTNYYHQYSITASYQFAGGNAPGTPSLTGNMYGFSVSTSLSLQASTIWLDANSAYSVTNTLAGRIAQERWYSTISEPGHVSGPIILSPTYSHQYLLTLTGALPGSTGQGWYDVGSTALATSWSAYEASPSNRIRLTAYSEDGGSSIPISAGLHQVPILVAMYSPHTLQFDSILQYSLTKVLPTNSIASMTLSPTGDSWYDTGTSVHIVLNRNWDAIGNTRQSLVSYSVDNTATTVDRASSDPTYVSTITMTASHVLSLGFVTQYFISAQGATLSGSQTGDGWFDSGSQFIVHGTYDRAYTANMPYHAYAIPVGFQILANTTVSSLLWTSSSNTLSFNAEHADVKVYIPSELNLAPTGVSDNGMPLAFSYLSSSHLLSFKGSSSFQVGLSGTNVASSFLSSLPDWVLYSSIVVAVGVVLVLGLVFLRRQARKTWPYWG